MKTIIFISNFLGNGGAGRVISILAEHFQKYGYHVIVASFPFEGYAYQLPTTIEQVTLETKPETSKIRRKILRIFSIRKVIKQFPGATVISFEYFINMETILASFGISNRLIISERNDPAQQDKNIIIKTFRNVLYSFCDKLVCQTTDAKSYFPKRIQKRSVIIPNPIAANLPDPFLGIRKKEIVNFCRIEKQKNLPLLIDAFAILLEKKSDYQLTIFGDGNENDNIIRYVNEKNMQNNVNIHKSIPNIHELIRDCAMFVSSSDYEGLSNSMIEAMGIGLPVICTDCPCGGARMVIEDGVNGLLVPVGDTEKLYLSMLRLIEDPSLAFKISRNAVAIRKTLSIEKILNEWQAIID